MKFDEVYSNGDVQSKTFQDYACYIIRYSQKLYQNDKWRLAFIRICLDNDMGIGIYKIDIKKVAAEVGIADILLLEILEKFNEKGTLYYDDRTREVYNYHYFEFFGLRDIGLKKSLESIDKIKSSILIRKMHDNTSNYVDADYSKSLKGNIRKLYKEKKNRYYYGNAA